MGMRDSLRNAFGGGGSQRSRSTPLTTRDIEKKQAAAKKEKAASKERSRRHKFSVARYGDKATIPFD